jgi:myosin heavy chain 9/10/11/14
MKVAFKMNNNVKEGAIKQAKKMQAQIKDVIRDAEEAKAAKKNWSLSARRRKAWSNC